MSTVWIVVLGAGLGTLVLKGLAPAVLGGRALPPRLTGAMALRYAWPGQPLAPPLPNLESQRELLVLHAVGGGLALMLGPWQFSARLRQRRPRMHRGLGWAYAACLLMAGLTAMPLATPALPSPAPMRAP